MLGKLFLIVGSFAFIMFAWPYKALAQDEYSVSAGDYQLPDGPFEVFGQIIDPSAINTGQGQVGWNELRLMMPIVIPDLQEHKMDANGLCDYMVQLSKLYSILMEQAQVPLANELGQMPYDLDMAPERYISDVMASSSLSGVKRLVTLMPEREKQIMLVREITLKANTAVLLHDAAINICSEYAKERGYKGVYVGFEPYNPANDSGWKDVPWYKEEHSESAE